MFWHKLFGTHIKGYTAEGLPIMPVGHLQKLKDPYDYAPKMIAQMAGKEIYDEFNCVICGMRLLETD